MVNVIPLNDEKAHMHASFCWCGPRVEWTDTDGTIFRNGPLIVHNAADRREAVERLWGEGVSPDKKWGCYVG